VYQIEAILKMKSENERVRVAKVNNGSFMFGLKFF
jgi:hypothetical protein